MAEKINLLIDTNAFSLLSLLEFRRQKLITLVFKYFNAYTCQTVFAEFGRTIYMANQDNKFTYRLLEKKKENIFPISRDTKAIEQRLINLEFIAKDFKDGKKDEGERHLACAAIEHVYKRRFSQCIIISEDARAIKGFIKKIVDVVPIGYIWSVFDLVMFLFLQYQINYDEAEYAVRELAGSNAVSIREYKDKSKTQESARQIMLEEQVGRLVTIKKLLASLPRR